jgi:hypothetical protein
VVPTRAERTSTAYTASELNEPTETPMRAVSQHFFSIIYSWLAACSEVAGLVGADWRELCNAVRFSGGAGLAAEFEGGKGGKGGEGGKGVKGGDGGKGWLMASRIE